MFIKTWVFIMFLATIDFGLNMLRPQLLSWPLERVDQEKYQIAEKLNYNPLVKKGPYTFWVSYSPLFNLRTASMAVNPRWQGNIFLSLSSLKEGPHFDAAIAHEMGHFEGCPPKNICFSDFDADEFAAKMVGPEKTLALLRYMSKTHGEYEGGNQRIHAMENRVISTESR